MSRVARTSALLAALALLALAAAGGAVAGSPQVHAAGKCHFHGTEQQHLGASYVTSLSVKNTSCRTGKAVAHAFNNCRHANGGARGHCHHRVKGYSCKEGRRSGISTQYDSSATCRRGAKRVHFTFTENT
jgi:hypothetical protein